MSSIKLSFNGEFRRLPLPNTKLSFTDLKEKTLAIFPGLNGQVLVFSWIDEDGDMIKFTSDEELQDAVKYLLKDGKKVLKFDVSVPTPVPTATSSAASSSDSSVDKPIHTSVTCDECGMSPIVGTRYKCSVREDFDLCDNCESRNVQPYPMVKIYHPDQNPLAILIAVRDDVHHRRHHHGGPGGKVGGRGCPMRRHHGFVPPGIHGPHQEHPLGAHPGAGAFAFGAHPNGPPHHRLGRWARCAAKKFADSMETSAPVSTTATVAANEIPQDEAADIERKIIEEVIRMSVDEETTRSVEVDTTRREVVDTKPKARFVKDVTFADGTVIQPGTHFLKSWRIRNDGCADWPAGSQLIAAGGDEMTAADAKVVLPATAAGQEADITVELVAPQHAGRYVGYFRLQSPDGENFGHRLWADIRVAEDDTSSLDWQVVSGVLASSSTVEPVAQEVAPVDTQATTSLASSVASSMTVDTISSVDLPEARATVTGTGPVHVNVEDSQVNASTSSIATDIWSRVYESELKVLRDMGFTDVNAIVPLLREHVGMPVSRNPELRGQPSAEGMQRVVIQLLGQSITA